MTADLSTAPATSGEDALFPPGAQTLVRDEVWLVRNATRTEHDGARIEAVGASDFVRDQEAVFFTGLDRIELLDPRQTRLVRDDSPNFRRSRLFLEAVLRKTPLPQSERGLALGSRTPSSWTRSPTSSVPRNWPCRAATCVPACSSRTSSASARPWRSASPSPS